METQVWTKSEEKFVNLLTLRGPEVHQLRVTGNMLTLKRNLKNVQEALAAGRPPADSGAKVVGTLDARSIAKAELSPGNASLTLHGEGEKPTKMSFTPGDHTANLILDAILAESGRPFRPTQEEIGVVEALVGPGIVGVIGGLLWMALYDSARKLAAGEEVEISGRRRGMQRLLVGVAETVGPNGAIALGVALLLLVGFWAFRQVTQRPMRTVLKPEAA